MNKKEVLMVIPHMVGGGAERVAAQIMNKINEYGYSTKFIITSAKKEDVICSDLNNKTELIILNEIIKNKSIKENIKYLPAKIFSSAIGKFYEKQNKEVPADIGKLSIQCQYHREIKWMHKYLINHPDMTVITFLQPSIPIVLLASLNLPNKIIISERADPNRLMKKRYGKKFIEKYYTRADVAVFQTEDAKRVYPKEISKKGIVIFNPLKDNLPPEYHGKRQKNITTFCRISKQKNLPVLIDAFKKVHKHNPDYKLRIIGDALNDEGIQVLNNIKKMISNYNLSESVVFEPFVSNVHEKVLKDAVYVNSSDYEGISNAMLEAMAIGMPVVCTDCPIGGAKATITDEENGLLVPVEDPESLSESILRIINDPVLSGKLSNNASKLRNTISLDAITKQWIELL